MVPFTDNLLRACRKLAIKLEASMRFQGRVFLSEIGTPEHDYSHLIQLFGEFVGCFLHGIDRKWHIWFIKHCASMLSSK